MRLAAVLIQEPRDVPGGPRRWGSTARRHDRAHDCILKEAREAHKNLASNTLNVLEFVS